MVVNSPGTINADYRGYICVVLINLSDEIFMIKDGEVIGQMIVAKHEKGRWISVDNLLEANRRAGGFGHTGKK